MEAKQRITVFCLTWGRRFAGLVYLVCLAALYSYIYMLYQSPTPMMTVLLVAYGVAAVGATALFGFVWCDWQQQGRDKRSRSIDEAETGPQHQSFV
jgi:hypothetical protein